jgi:hypothetical protein
VDENLSEANGQHVLGGLCRTITNVWHLIHALEAPAHPVVDTLGLTPVTAQLAIAVTLFKNNLSLSLRVSTPIQIIAREQQFGLARYFKLYVTWWRVNFLVRFLTILGLEAGVIAMV